MVKIGKSYVTEEGDTARLCADITVGGRNREFCFFAERKYGKDFSVGCSDAFVMALLPLAMERGEDIVCEEAMSRRLHYQLCEYLIPAIVLAGSRWHTIAVRASLMEETPVRRGKRGTVFFPWEKDKVERKRFVRKQQLQAVCIDLSDDKGRENPLQKGAGTEPFGRLACGLALQGMFSVCVLPWQKGGKATDFGLSQGKNTDAFFLLAVQCASTEGLSFLICGYRQRRKPAEQISHIVKSCRRQCISKNKKKIVIGTPYIERAGDDGFRLCASVSMEGKKETVWFEGEAPYGKYLTQERGDAFVTALLTTAMRQGADIVCEAPVTSRLLYQINTCLVPMLSDHIADYSPITVHAGPAQAPLPCEGAVVCGWTGGVDSMFTYLRNLDTVSAGYRLTHLLVANNGAIEGEQAADTFRKMTEKAKKGFARERNLEVVGVDTNLQEILQEKFATVVYIRHVSVILALQKLFRVFLYSSASPFCKFRFDRYNASYYDALMLPCFETEQTVFYCSGAAFSRLEKLKELSDFPLAHRMLHPCIYALREKNCGACGKCIRTMAGLYSLGTLERFSDVFDTATFEKKKDWYLAKVLQNFAQGDCKDVIEALRQQGEDLTRAKRMVRTMRIQGKKR